MTWEIEDRDRIAEERDDAVGFFAGTEVASGAAEVGVAERPRLIAVMLRCVADYYAKNPRDVRNSVQKTSARVKMHRSAEFMFDCRIDQWLAAFLKL